MKCTQCWHRTHSRKFIKAPWKRLAKPQFSENKLWQQRQLQRCRACGGAGGGGRGGWQFTQDLLSTPLQNLAAIPTTSLASLNSLWTLSPARKRAALAFLNLLLLAHMNYLPLHFSVPNVITPISTGCPCPGATSTLDIASVNTLKQPASGGRGCCEWWSKQQTDKMERKGFLRPGQRFLLTPPAENYVTVRTRRQVSEMCLCVSMCMCAWVYVCLHICAHVRVSIYLFVCVCVYVHTLRMYKWLIFVYIYTHT